MSLEPLAKEGSWTAYLDEESTGLVYYFNTVTGESSWDPPTSTFPRVKMSRRKEAKMTAMNKEYNEKYASGATMENNDDNNTDMKSGFGGTGMFTSFFSPKGDEESAKVVDEINKVEASARNAKKGTPLSKIFGSGGGDDSNSVPGGQDVAATSTSASTATSDEINDSPNWFDGFFKQNNEPSQETEATSETVSEQVNGSRVNGGTNGSSNEAAPALFGNLFAPKTEVVEEEEDLDQFYDQLQFEDAVLAEEVEEPTPIKLEIASKIMPHPEKMSWGGEDALFVSGKSFGVFDGVSGAEKVDGMPLYSNTLAQKLKSSVGKGGLSIEEIKAKMLTAAEYADMSATGASTAVVASIGDDDILRVVNVGDSVCMIIRDGKIAARAKETVHYFDCPFQLSDDSPDRPRNGSIMQTPLKKGDLIIAGSDGVFDNLSDSLILEIAEKNSKGSISKLVQQISIESRKISKDPEAVTPYALVAKKNNYAAYSRGVGGKLDDIGCVAVRCK